ncbi:hypothetical protein J6590_074011 [Homalodisca vitripennis]|nr:hypothetical protein J6590_074011 [Homalodisca vitripennis]
MVGERHWETLLELRRTVRNRRRGLLSSVVLLHAWLHVTAITQAQLDKFVGNYWIIQRTALTAPSDFHRFLKQGISDWRTH